MKKTLLAASLALALAPSASAEIFISEYVEGSGNNKALELYNPGSAAVNLTGYRLRVFFNGSISSTNINLSGIVSPGSTFVVVHSAATADLRDLANLISGSAAWNGNDAIVLEKEGVVIDSFGRVGENPGVAWIANGVTTLDRSLRRKDVLYDTQIDDAFDPSVQWLEFPRDDFSDIGLFNGSGGAEEPEEPPVEHSLVCGADFTSIAAIQGAGNSSPLTGQTVVVEAIVTHTLPGLRGYMLQAAAHEQDNNPLTSEGVFVYTNSTNLGVTTGQRVRLKAQVAEYFANTQLQNITATIDCGTAALPAPVTISLPVANADYLERYEGMLVHFAQELTVNGNYTLGRYGELVLAKGRRYTPTQVVTPGAAAQALAAEQQLNRIVLDDASTVQNPPLVPYPAPALSAANTVRAGDTVNGLTGTLYYSFDEYRINPTQPVNFIASNPRTPQPELSGDGNVKIASFNVLNYFNGNGQGGGFPTARGANNLLEFGRQKAKILAALTALDATVIGLMEIENDGFSANSAIADLVSGLRQESGESGWQFISVNTPVIGTDEITVGMLYRADLVTPVAAAKVLDASNSARDANNVVLFDTSRNRPMLAQRFRLLENNAEFAVMVNHLKSKGSACAGDPDLNDGQGNCNQTRTRAAQAIGLFAAEHFDDIPALVIGDLNAYAKEDPLTMLASAGYVNVFDVLGKTPGYGYVFNNLSGHLDHALLNSKAQDYLVDAADWHINADEPISLDYNLEFKTLQQQTDFYAPDAYRSSDHDPAVVALQLPASYRAADLDQNGVIDQRDITLFQQLLRQGGALSLSLDFNGDGVVDQRDVRALTALCDLPRCVSPQ